MDLLHFWDGEGLTGIDVVGGVFTLTAPVGRVELMFKKKKKKSTTDCGDYEHVDGQVEFDGGWHVHGHFLLTT
jgi:hypothetical protein